MAVPRIAVFAKAPRAGFVKTRLTAEITPGEAAAWHERFVRRTLRTALAVPGATVELHTDVATEAWSDIGVARALQAPGDLGARMLAVLEAGSHVMIVGSDAPALTVDDLRALLSSPADVTLGPCEDGGYWGIACRRTHAAMFAGVEWSTAGACAQTASACVACGLSVAFGPGCWDVDEPADLERWLRRADAG